MNEQVKTICRGRCRPRDQGILQKEKFAAHGSSGSASAKGGRPPWQRGASAINTDDNLFCSKMDGSPEKEVFNPVKDSSVFPEFKKPVIIGKRPGVQKTIPVKEREVDQSLNNNPKLTETEVVNSKESSVSSDKKTVGKEKISCPAAVADVANYREPKWSGLCGTTKFGLEILKNGIIIQHLDLALKAYFVIGRLPVCDIVLEHPSVSRFHAVLQYKAVSDSANKEEIGWYLYDLGSTHGTVVNKKQIQSKVYSRVRVGHIFKFGVSTRLFILQGPEEDQEAESELTVTELTQLKELKKKEEASTASQLQLSQSKGIDWGMGEDAQEDENPMAENPFAVIEEGNEDLFLDDPKKTLRGWFEREGYELEYKVEEKSYAHFVCRIDLPIDSATGAPISAEATVKGGKKKEAVVQCALEACRILDRHGLLRKSNHESKASQKKRRCDDDYYSSDEDTFFDRTGAAERKRHAKIKDKAADNVETYDSLMLKYDNIGKEIAQIRDSLDAASTASKATSDMETDDLDSYITALQAQESKPKKSAAALRVMLHQLEKEQSKLKVLINVARPTLIPQPKIAPGTTSEKWPSGITAKSTEQTEREKRPSDQMNVPKISSSNKKTTGFSPTLPETHRVDTAVQPTVTEPVITPREQMQQNSTDPLPTSVSTNPPKNIDLKRTIVEKMTRSEEVPQRTTSASAPLETHSSDGNDKSGLVIRRKRPRNESKLAAEKPEECADSLLSLLEQQLVQAEEECQEYKHFLTKIAKDPEDGNLSSLEALEKELHGLQLEESQLKGELKELELKQQLVLQEMEEEKAEKSVIEQEEERYWKLYSVHHHQRYQALDEQTSLECQLQHVQSNLDRLKQTNAFNATFHLWHVGHFGTINEWKKDVLKIELLANGILSKSNLIRKSSGQKH
uniref:EOG090X026V n=1 Tax=Alona affinis TaxID=381656 RepID=A0A9N6WQP2_9CRUS|nr:EOG090X026V [Alona affinis]